MDIDLKFNYFKQIIEVNSTSIESYDHPSVKKFSNSIYLKLKLGDWLLKL